MLLASVGSNPEMTKLEVVKAGDPSGLPNNKQHQLLDLAMRILTMVNCSSKDLTLGLVEYGVAQHEWRDNMTPKELL